MQTSRLIRTCSILGALGLGGCPSDGESASGTASNGGTATESNTESDSDSDSDSDSNTQGSNSATQGSDTETTTDTNPTSVDTTNDTDPTDTDPTDTDPTTDTDPSDTDPSSSSVTDSDTDPTDASSSSDGGESSSSGGGESSSSGAVSASVTDSDSDSDTVDPNCEAPGELTPCDADTDDPFQAIGLGCDGDANQVIPIDNQVFNSNDGTAWRIARQYGTFIDPVTNEPLWGPREGEQMLMLSTGSIPAPNGQGVVTQAAGATQGGTSNGNPDNVQMPAPAVAQDGGQGGPFVNCDGVGDCSNTLETQWNFGGGAANDLAWMQFDTVVPGGTNGFVFDFAYFSAEFPEYVDTTFNDIFLAWSASETYTGNLCFINDQPCTVSALCDNDDTCPDLAYCDDSLDFFGQCANPAGGELAGTGFDGFGGATGWFTAQGSAAPLETLQLTFAVFDMGDTIYDTTVLLDNWHWDCEGCVPSEVNGCGIEPTP